MLEPLSGRVILLINLQDVGTEMAQVVSRDRLPSLFTPDRLGWTVFALALPAVGEQFLNTLVGLTDTYLVGHLDPAVAARLGYDRATALASVGLAQLMSWVMTVLFMAVAIGATAVVARRIGAGDEARANLALRQALLLTIVAGLLGTLIGVFLGRPALQLLGAPPAVAYYGSQYLTIVSLAFVPTALMFAATAALRGAGDTRSPLLLMALVNSVNVAISWMLVNGHLGAPGLGIAGSASGTAIARTLGAVVILGLLLAGRMRLRLHPDLRPDWPTLRSIVNVGLPSAGEQLAFQSGIMIMARVINSLGTVAYAAHTMTVTIESVSFLPGLGFAVAATTLVGQSLGAERPERAERSTWVALWQGGLMMTLLGVVMAAAPEALLRLMTPEDAVVAAGALPLRLAGLAQPLLAISFVLNGALRGAGDTRWPMLVRLISTWLVRLPMALLLVSFWGLAGVWLALGADFGVQSVLSLWRFRAGRWKLIEV